MALPRLYILCLLLMLFSGCSGNKFVQKSTELGDKDKLNLNTRMNTLEVEKLLKRITAAEDKLEILTLLAGSAFSSDVASESYWTKMFTADALFDRGAERPQDKGRDEILKVVNSPDQREAIKYGMTHLAMLPHIILNSDSAIATGCLLIVMPDSTASHVKLPGKGISGGFSIYQLTVNRWELVRTAEGWKVTQRTVRPITSNDSRDILKHAIESSK